MTVMLSFSRPGMLRSYTHILKRRGVPVVSYFSTESNESSLQLSQRELREKAIADALAREEEALAKVKALRELKEKTKELIGTLNKTPTSLIHARLDKLQSSIKGLKNQDKIKQLDEELEEFMFNQMNIPYGEISNHPWAAKSVSEKKQTSNSSLDSSSTSGSQSTIKSTSSHSYTNEFPNLKPTPDYKPYSEQELYLRQLSHSRNSGSLGSELTNIYRARDEVRRPKTISEVTINKLMAAGCHLGHSKALWRPSTQPFLYGEYDGVHLIDLNETMVALKRAAKVAKGVAGQGGVILYVGTSKNWEQSRSVEEAANRSNGYYVSKRWIPGTITNFTEVTKQVDVNSRKEVDMLDLPTNRVLDPAVNGGIIKPDLVVILNPVENRNCINECIKSRIPTIGLCDTDMEPSLLTYPIPCNDDSMRATSLMVGILSKAAEEGLNQRHEIVSKYRKDAAKAGSETSQVVKKFSKRRN
ncbi:37S ribosomal protein Mrp4p, mitochondrial [[Candida] railenensis]|uniref:37S ribosomal protein Mrp4p, mitochondrial n=1 Tax=[Candida] railenensis TaxID=45579 RepID=A0A9P0QRP9_9ASCO|nr:37S ribosomal protein Mrp4p, mitochondrial [[Candida] railenensis]